MIKRNGKTCFFLKTQFTDKLVSAVVNEFAAEFETFISSTPEKYQQFLHVGPRPMTLENLHFAKQIKKILVRFPFVRTGRSVRPFCKWYASVLRTGSGRSGQTGPPLIVGPSSSHAPAGGNAGSARKNFFLARFLSQPLHN